MSIYDWNMTQAANDSLPVKKRTKENKSFLRGLLSQVQRQWQIFLSYLHGADVELGSSYWAAGSYLKGATVIYLKSGEVFEAQVNTSTEPTTSTDWLKIMDSFIGTDERQNFDGMLLELTYALNRRFNTSFVPPPGTSQIYIIVQTPSILMFKVGFTDADSSFVGIADAETSGVTYNDTTVASVHFTIMIPTALFTALGVNAGKIIHDFADQYVAAGIKYDYDDY